MNTRPGTLVAAILVVVVGFAIGGWLAIRARGPAEPARHLTVAATASTPRPLRAPPATKPKGNPTAAPIRTPAATPTPFATPTVLASVRPVATPEPAPTQRVASARVPSASSATPPAAVAGLQGSWQLDEANVQVGSIVWVGAAAPRGNSLDLDVHKQSVGGRPAVPCERQTGLHATFAIGVAGQTVPFREVNCNGVVSTGEVHVTSFSGGSFSGTFSQDGANLGTFTARKI